MTNASEFGTRAVQIQKSDKDKCFIFCLLWDHFDYFEDFYGTSLLTQGLDLCRNKPSTKKRIFKIKVSGILLWTG